MHAIKKQNKNFLQHKKNWSDWSKMNQFRLTPKKMITAKTKYVNSEKKDYQLWIITGAITQNRHSKHNQNYKNGLAVSPEGGGGGETENTPLTPRGEKGAVTLRKVTHQIHPTQRREGHKTWQGAMEGDRQEERDMRGRKGEAGLPDEPQK